MPIEGTVTPEDAAGSSGESTGPKASPNPRSDGDGLSLLETMGLFSGVVVLFFALMTGMILIIMHNGNGKTASSAAGTNVTATAPSGAPANAAPVAFAQSDVPVVVREYRVEVPATTISPGLKTLRISNFGTVPHELLVFRSDLDPSAYPTQNGNINEEASSIPKVSDGDNLAPGTVQTRVLDLSTPGKYLFVCNLPGHFKLGMYAVVTVSAPASAPTVSLAEFKVTTPTDVAAGKYEYTILNNGTVQHELLVFHTTIAAAQLPLGPDGNIAENAPGLNKISDGDNIDPGKGQTRAIDLSQPGTYVFVCNLPRHYGSGMFMQVTVH
jgi:uncharacterized cupredoxin-like copper-binding protein